MSSTSGPLSVVVPAYQEAALIADSLHVLAAELQQRGLGDVEVLVVVADSPDGTARLARSCAPLFADLRVIAAGPRQGKGRDVRLGLQAARGRHRLFMDADLATPLAHLDDVVRCIDDDVELAIAVRDLRLAHDAFGRRSIARVGNVISRAMLLRGIPDTQCGFKLLRDDVCADVLPRCTVDGWGFDLELLAVARRFGYAITTFDAPDWHDPKAADAGLAGDAPLRQAVTVLGSLMHIRTGLWRGRYDAHDVDDVTPLGKEPSWSLAIDPGLPR